MRMESQLFLVLLFPFADLRGFLGAKTGRLSRPSWPLAEPERDFVRSSGPVRARPRGGVEEWAGEELYGNAAQALRLPNHLGDAKFGSGSVRGIVDHTFRRFYSEGTVGRLEVGFRLRVKSSASGVSSLEWLALLREVLEIPVRVRDINQQTQTVKLIRAGDILAEHYLAATTDRQLNPQASPQPWWFCAGAPGLVVEYPRSSPVLLPPHTQHVLDVPKAEAALSHAWLKIGNQRFSAWFLAIGKGDSDGVRRLRIHLARLHAECECLKIILIHVKDDGKLDLAKNPASSDTIQQYLNDSIRAIEKPERFGLPQTVMFNAAREALGIAFPGKTTSLQHIRRQVATKVAGYIRRAQSVATVVYNIEKIQGDVMNTTIQFGDDATISGEFTVVTATNIKNSFNKTTNSDVTDDLKEKLKAVAVEVTKLAKMLPPDDAENVSKDLEALTSEAVSKRPRKEWYELSARGIVDAAKAIGEMATPVTVAVKAVLALLAK